MIARIEEWLEAPLVVVGAGAAGLSAALASHGAMVLADTAPGEGGSSPLAQGGMAATVAADDSAADHVADTMNAGAGLVEAEVAAAVCGAGAETVVWLAAQGVHFDRAGDGSLHLHREAAHGRARIVHARDHTGQEIVRALAAAVAAREDIDLWVGVEVVALQMDGGRVAGVIARRADGGHIGITAPAVLVATGGYAHLWARTTAPAQAVGGGLALAMRAGATVADLEMVQFHPTALDVGGDPRPLLTEALRGAGGLLVDGEGTRFMVGRHPDAELAPRDVVARGVYAQLQSGARAALDLRHLGDHLAAEFPGVVATARAHGLDACRDPLPVTSVAHYCMGGVAAGPDGATTVPGLWVAGEVASTGLHGANRLASNSLLEAVVMGRRAAAAMAASMAAAVRPWNAPWALPSRVDVPGVIRPTDLAEIREVLWQHAGVIRDGAGLRLAGHRLGAIAARYPGAPPNEVLVARQVVRFALARPESRGAHFRSDHPEPDAVWARRRVEVVR